MISLWLSQQKSQHSITIIMLFILLCLTHPRLSHGGEQDMELEEYRYLLQQHFLTELSRHGFHQGYDFENSDSETGFYIDKYTPEVTGTISYYGLVYLPLNSDFLRSFKLTMTRTENGIAIVQEKSSSNLRRQITSPPQTQSDTEYYDNTEWQKDPFAYPQSQVTEKPVQLSPYPGIAYFESQLTELRNSIEHFKPKLHDKHFKEDIDLTHGPFAIMERAYYIAEIDQNSVEIAFLFDTDSQIRFGYHFHYNLNTGEVSEIRYISPPMLM
ncbi:hypothetical protein [Motilimonas pumila]|uniref:Uncharacterized protein n=1 Tax=Motilimonas pumila TaxID=2303987 RepID=A0A418YET0_9GAMM|nr:hypothetical protein [Motilimonas pumila]RJG47689.1 hypothetical protein D1Z90_09775 [Motilimonas pumila]